MYCTNHEIIENPDEVVALAVLLILAVALIAFRVIDWLDSRR